MRIATHTSRSLINRVTWRAVLAAACLLGLDACGGGGGGPAVDTPAPSPVVANATPDRLSYGQSSMFTVTGSNLSSAVTFTATGCDNLAVASGGTATQQVFSCTPSSALAITVRAAAGGAQIYSANFVVPKPQVTLVTTMGTVVVELEPSVVQLTVDNFLGYVRSGFYDGTLFHRVVQGFVSQGGGFTAVANGTLTPKSGAVTAIALETNKGLSNTRGTIAMARTSSPDSATSQFFFNWTDNLFLDYSNAQNPGYAVFGHIVSGLSVIDAMDGVPTQTVGGFTNVPVTNIVLQSAAQTK